MSMSSTPVKKHGGFFSPKFKPKKFQLESVRFGISRPAAGFFLAPGLGKTMIILIIFRILKKLGLVDELVVVAQKRVMQEVWPRELKKWNLPFKYRTIHGPKKLRRLQRPADIRLINYDGLTWLKRQRWFFRRKVRLMLACDESSKLRNTGTQRFRALKKILPWFKRRYIMTGSPAPKGFMNLFGQVYVLDLGSALGTYITHYRNTYFTPTGFGGYDWKLARGSRKKIFRKIKPMVIRYGTDQLNLPPINFFDRFVDLPKKARRMYDDMERELIIEWKTGDITAANAAVATGKLRQMANGAVYHNDRDRGYKVIHQEKLDDLVELLEELQGEPALVSYEFGHDRDQIVKYFKRHAPQFKGAPFIGGKTKEKELRAYLRAWDRGDEAVIFSNVSHGLNMQGKGGIVIYFAMTWDLEYYKQFYLRVWRQGQERRVLVYRILARNTVDEDQVARLAMKDKREQSILVAMERRRHGLH